MPLLPLPAVFMRGGTSRAVMFHLRDHQIVPYGILSSSQPWAAPIRMVGS